MGLKKGRARSADESDDSESEPEIQLFNTSNKSKNRATKRNFDETQKSETLVSEPLKKSRKVIASENKENYEGSFEDLNLEPWLCRTLKSLTITKPTPVQRHCIPEILNGSNVLATSETGSGKTAAFVLPVLQKLSEDPYGVFCLVITPTRELAIQINDQVKIFGSSVNVKTCLIIGGNSTFTQTVDVEKRPHFIIATPGRLIATLTGANPPFLKHLKFLVIDEADRLFSPELEKYTRMVLDHEAIIKSENKRQMLLFSATTEVVEEKLKQVASVGPNKVFEFKLTLNDTTVDKIDERYILCPKQVKLCYFIYLIQKLTPLNLVDDSALKQTELIKNSLRKKRQNQLKNVEIVDDSESEESEEDIIKESKQVDVLEIPKLKRANQLIVFTSTCEMCELVLETLRQLKFSSNSVVSLHSGIDQPRRTANLGKFKSGLASILVATDVASRGLDIPKVDLVINFDLPYKPEEYIHRCGRTARAGKKGRAITLVTERDVKRKKIEEIEALTKKQIKKLAGIIEDDVLILLTRTTNAVQKARMEIDRTERGEDGTKNKKKKRQKK